MCECFINFRNSELWELYSAVFIVHVSMLQLKSACIWFHLWILWTELWMICWIIIICVIYAKCILSFMGILPSCPNNVLGHILDEPSKVFEAQFGCALKSYRGTIWMCP
jgi:hypothetical protein